nr:hypothetical protein [Hyphomonas sp. Mor2]
MSSIVIDKPTRSTWLKPVEQTRVTPRKKWELHLVIPGGERNVFGRATLRTVPESGLFSERVKLIIWTQNTSPGDFGWQTDVDGMRLADSVDLHVHIFGSPLRFNPMDCRGVALTDQTRYEGSWTMPCMKPQDCGCEGVSGKFFLSEL